MSDPVQDKVIVITGASRGLGHGMAARLAARGAKLGLCARSAPGAWADLGGAAAAAVHAASLDVTDGRAVRAFADAVAGALGPIDLWVNNAGVLEPITFVRDLTADALRAHLEINLIGVLHGTQAYLAHLRASSHPGVLINISSGAAQKGYAGWGAYCTGKAAVDRLTECLHAECLHAERDPTDPDLRAYAVAPGIIDTDMQALIRSKSPDEFPDVQKFKDFKRDEAFNTPAYVADRLVALAFDPAQRPDGVVVRVPPQTG